MKSKFPSSIKIDRQIKEAMDEWCYINRVSFSSKMEELAKDFLAKNPLSKEEKAFAAKHQKEEDTKFQNIADSLAEGDKMAGVKVKTTVTSKAGKTYTGKKK